MLFSKNRNLIRWIIIVASFGIISLILWNTYVFFQEFKIEEQSKLDIWAAAYQEINSNPLDENINPLVDKVFTSEITNPMFVYNNGSVLLSNNINENRINNATYINKLISEYSQENTPIVISYEDNISKEQIIELLDKKIESVSFSSIKEDVVRFIKNDEALDIWSPQYFKDLISKMKFEYSSK